MPIDLLYQDRHVLLCCKPAGLDSEREFPARLSGETGSDPLYCVHRLDRAAGGLMVYARSKAAAAGLSAQIAEGRGELKAQALGEGQPGAALAVETVAVPGRVLQPELADSCHGQTPFPSSVSARRIR